MFFRFQNKNKSGIKCFKHVNSPLFRKPDNNTISVHLLSQIKHILLSFLITFISLLQFLEVIGGDGSKVSVGVDFHRLLNLSLNIYYFKIIVSLRMIKTCVKLFNFYRYRWREMWPVWPWLCTKRTTQYGSPSAQ